MLAAALCAGVTSTRDLRRSDAHTRDGVFGGTIHVTTSFWNGPPSQADLNSAFPGPTLNIVIAPGTTQNPSGQPTVYFFTPQGCTCQMPLKDFK
jgi:hypothetical protein